MADNEKMFQVKIITPDRIFYTGEAEMVEYLRLSLLLQIFLPARRNLRLFQQMGADRRKA